MDEVWFWGIENIDEVEFDVDSLDILSLTWDATR